MRFDMRIGIYTECLAKQYTGVEMMTHLLVESLAEKHQVTCFHAKKASHPKFPQCVHKVFRAPLPIPAYNQFASLFRLRCFNNLDVLHLPHPHVPFLKKPAAPTVMTVHDIIPAVHPEFHNVKRNFYFRRILPYFVHKMDAILASSESTKKDLIKQYGADKNKIHVVHLALPDKKNIQRSPKDEILYLGTLEPRKNVEGILRAHHILKKEGFSHKLIIAGAKGWNYDKVFSLVRELGLQNEVDFKGYVNEEEKRNLYQNASIFVWPSFYEGFGLPVLEAMQYGVPTVTSNTSSLPEITGDSAMLCDPNSPESIASAMRAILESPEKQQELSQKGTARAKQFSMENYINRTLEVYQKVRR